MKRKTMLQKLAASPRFNLALESATSPEARSELLRARETGDWAAPKTMTVTRAIKALGIGGTVFIPGKKIHNVSSRCNQIKKVNGGKYVCRALNGMGRDGIQVWRTA